MKKEQILNLIHKYSLGDSCLWRIESQLNKLKTVNPAKYESTLHEWENRAFTIETFFKFIWDEKNGFRGEHALINLYD